MSTPVVFLITLEDAFNYLQAKLVEYKGKPQNEPKSTSATPDELFVIRSVFKQLVDLLLDEGINYSETLHCLCKAIEENGHDRIQTREICDTVFSLIINKLIEFMPGFGDDRYRKKYSYKMVNQSDIQIDIENEIYKKS